MPLLKDLIMRAKRKVAAERRRLLSLVAAVPRLARKHSRNSRNIERVFASVSKATGGPMPGVDFFSFSALQEFDDLEYVNRMKRLG
jgi:hypothetical protein